ncbi:flagellar hook-basal body complex protein FliE [Papillibacter cinnamivorans]|uniref:Flagellar hook-basal body complex protein FliE n=1 Tax=Papillibacter cinnamivorans DSM 12816 TaxID=1122930 RepID=A0A1W1YGV2_9FIRM|nr:flagellar hook-basal body complex protein FliE [Papillibacter cinnamivorans]SMC35366.1 flagellar hook-basal body complex protein FliE [Papillibacter cinnamivorans DSM 12816]
MLYDMDIQALNSATRFMNSSGNLSGKSAGDSNFSEFLSDAYDLAKSTDLQDKSSALSLLTGSEDDIASAMVDSEKAELALSLTIEIRNKVMDAYKEILNMQV